MYDDKAVEYLINFSSIVFKEPHIKALFNLKMLTVAVTAPV